MKTYIKLPTILQIFSLIALVIGSVFLFSGLSYNTNKGRDSKAIADKLNEEKFEKSEDKKNAAYLVAVAEIHLKEIYLAQLAQKKAKHIDVKELGKMMEKINSNTLNALTTLAGKKSISLPDNTTQQGLLAIEFLHKKSGLAFDKEYCDMMVVSQKHTIKILEEITDESTDPEIKIWAFCTLPAMRKHLEYAVMCQNKYAQL